MARIVVVEDSAELAQVLSEGGLTRGVILFDVGEAAPEEAGPLGRLLDGIERIVERVGEPSKSVVEFMDVAIDLGQRTVRVGDKMLNLTAREFEIVEVLAHRANRVVSRREILETIWGIDNLRTSRVLGVHMSALRGKINRPQLIQTVHGLGYRLCLAPPTRQLPNQP